MLQKESKIEILDDEFNDKISIPETKKEPDIIPIVDDISDSSDDNIDEILNKLTDYFDQRYMLKNNQNQQVSKSGFNFEMIIGLIITSVIPIIMKKLDINNIGNNINNAFDNIKRTEQDNNKPTNKPENSGNETETRNEPTKTQDVETPENPQFSRPLTETIG